MTLPLGSRELGEQAGLLADAADHLRRERAASYAEADLLPGTGFTGLSADAALRALTTAAGGWTPTILALSRAAEVLRLAASLQLDLEAVLSRLTVLAGPRLDVSAPVVLLLGWLHASGELLDAMTATSLLALRHGDGASVDPPAGWGEDRAAELQAAHDLYYDAASPRVRELADAHGLTLLQLPEVGFVAAAADPPTLAASTHLITHVPGVGSLDPGSWDSHVSQARDMAAAVDGEGGGVGVVWLGYQAPPTVLHGGDSFPARRGAVDLASFQHQLGLRFPDAARTVVGYSYGSVVVGYSAHPRTGGLSADDVVFVGSPGTGARHASELQLLSQDPRVHAVTVAGDPISLATGPLAGVHGVDPTSPGFGANVWEIDAGVMGDHSWYFRAGPDSTSAFLDAFGKEVGPRP
ncbi:alpha/beta hydrolase [Corynebacterium guangdongense]|uniref:DUF1023 domain-containing protein n=1 Tax=Corynebacterium guangdongense TaxID=1783348 RepID=A0ABU1ZZN1_9CORY|nr:alpha/beta hydrolase [Corynebacterium guangdongense]MDR7330382.1 hypothetical protein [Corynebacterium guangdongense]WJZ18940.1 hypothetical protein CGUA_12020 [Corynebacterium guangdongense]